MTPKSPPAEGSYNLSLFDELEPVTRTPRVVFTPPKARSQPVEQAPHTIHAGRMYDEYGDLIVRTQEYWKGVAPQVHREIWGNLIPKLIGVRGVKGVTEQWWCRAELTRLLPSLSGLHPFDVALSELVFADLVESEERKIRYRLPETSRELRGCAQCYRWVGPRRLAYLEENYALYGLPEPPADILKKRQKERAAQVQREEEARSLAEKVARLNVPISSYARLLLEVLCSRERVGLIGACRVLGLPTGRTLEVLRELTSKGLVREIKEGHDAWWLALEDGLGWWARYVRMRKDEGAQSTAQGRPRKGESKAQTRAFRQSSLL